MSYCGQATTVNCFHTHITASKLKCKRWTCDDCQPDRCRYVACQALAGRPDMFITLTVNPAFGDSPAQRAISLRNAWRIIRRRATVEAMRPTTKAPGWKQRRIAWAAYADDNKIWSNRVRLHDGKLPFTVSVEETEAGEPHMHILCRAEWIDWRWLKAQLEDLTGAWIIDVKRIRNPKKVAAYVAKYIGKGPAKFEGMKRHWRSRDYTVDQLEEDELPVIDQGVRWRHKKTLEVYVKPWQDAGYRVDWQGNRAIITPP